MGSLETAKISGVALISILLGALMMVISVMLIQSREELSRSESVQFSVWIFSLLTVWSGFLQCFCGICLLIRKILIRRWITVNAIAFITMMLAVCILSSTILRDPTDEVEVTSANKSATKKDVSVQIPVIDIDMDASNETESTETESVGGVSMENFVEEEAPLTTNLTGPENVPGKGKNETKDVQKTESYLGKANATKMLHIYCGALIVNFILLPIFLGQMATRVRVEFKGKQSRLVERTYVYPLMSS